MLYLLSDVREWEEFQSVCSHPEEGGGDWEGLTSTAARQRNWRLYHTTTIVSPAVSTSLMVHATHTRTDTHIQPHSGECGREITFQCEICETKLSQ